MKTSSLTSTKPPTAVRMPRKSSLYFKGLTGLVERPRRRAEPGGGRGGGVPDRVHLARGGCVGIMEGLAVGLELVPRLLADLRRVDRGQPGARRQLLHRRPFGRHRPGALDRNQLLVPLGRAGGEQEQEGEDRSGAVEPHVPKTNVETEPFRTGSVE